MALKKKVRKIRARAKTGLAAAPLDSFSKLRFYFHYEMDAKEISPIIKGWIKSEFSKEDAKAILANPEYHFTMHAHFAACIFWNSLNLEIDDEHYKKWPTVAHSYYEDILESGKAILKEKAESTSDSTSNVVKLNPHQRLMNKINDTIMTDIELLFEDWADGEKNSLDLYAQFKKHGLTGSATEPVRKQVELQLTEYRDAYSGDCADAVEGWSHVTKPELKRRIKALEEMLSDLDKIKNAAKATRKTRIKKPRAADKQVDKLQYLKESNEYKIVSILPIQIIGSMRLYVFNTKTRELIEYISESVSGFEVKGTTLQNISNASRKTRLRKPEEFLGIVQSKTPRQIDNEWQKLTTKTSKPNGRINTDCVLLRSLDS